MGRRKSSAARDLFDVVAAMPWWVGVAGALISWLVCQVLVSVLSSGANAAAAQVASARPGQLTGFSSWALHALFGALAYWGRIILPVLCLAGSAASLARERTGSRLLKTATGSGSAQAVSALTWQQFEQLVGAHFSAQGFAVQRTGGSGPDGGVDLHLRRGNELFLVQCKQWKAFSVGVGVVRELYGVMAAEGAAGGYVVTSGQFTSDAREFASGRNIVMVDGLVLRQMLNTKQAKLTPNAVRLPPAPPRAAAEPALTPKCPSCGSDMVRRTAKKGANAGESFWGCVSYPKCRGTLRGQ